MDPGVLAFMWIQAFLLGLNHLAVTDKLPDLLSEETTSFFFFPSQFGIGDRKAGFAKNIQVH